MKLDGSLASVWGSAPGERRMRFPCDRYLSDIDGEYFRATDVRAPAAVLFRWLCQLKVAPYSYDLIDNFGRRSPRELTPGVENLARGQKPVGIFELVDFERGWAPDGDDERSAGDLDLRAYRVELRRLADLG